MKKIKIYEATPIQLNYLVAKCDGHQVGIITAEEQWERFIDRATAEELAENAVEFAEIRAGFKTVICKIHDDGYKSEVDARDWRYSTDWAKGGPIIERERINIGPVGALWWAGTASNNQDGPTPLIAAMRCYCYAKLGDTVEVPDEICD